MGAPERVPAAPYTGSLSGAAGLYGQIIDTGRRIERPPYPHPHHVTSCQRGARKPRGRSERRTFGECDQPLMRRRVESGFDREGGGEGKGVEGRWPPRDLLLSHVTA